MRKSNDPAPDGGKFWHCENVTRILVHIHVFYPDLWPELRACLHTMDIVDCDVHVTMTRDYPDIRRDIQSFRADAVIRIIENKGYDVGAFMHVLRHVDLKQDDYVVKLHTKRDMPQGAFLGSYHVGGARWRNYALAFLQTNFKKCLDAFQDNPTLGMCAHYRLITQKERDPTQTVRHGMTLLAQMGLAPEKKAFVAGPMFMARARLLAPLVSTGLDIDDFTVPVRGEETSLAHTLERVLGWMIGAQGYDVLDCFTGAFEQWREKWARPFRRLAHFLYRSRTTDEGERVIRICRIPFRIK